MFKLANVVMLPTNVKAQINDLCIGGINKELFQLKTYNSIFNFNQFQDWNLQHLYITSDEEIKDNDWYIVNGFIKKCISIGKSNNDIYLVDELGNQDIIIFCHKIIATTDTSLTKEMYCVSSGKYQEHLPLIPQQFIQYFLEEYNKGNIITEVMVEYYFTHETNGDKPLCVKINSDNTINIKLIKDSWSREEVSNLLVNAMGDAVKNDRTLNHTSIAEFAINWIEQNL